MRIAVSRTAPDTFSLVLGDTQATLDAAALKTLLVEVTRVLAPGADVVATDEERVAAFLRQLAKASDLGLQKLLQASRHDDVLALLKAAEADKGLTLRIYASVSDRSRKIFLEDLAFKFPDGMPPGRLRHAVESLSRTARQLEDDGTPVFAPPPPPAKA